MEGIIGGLKEISRVIPDRFYKDMEVLDLSTPQGIDRSEKMLKALNPERCFVGRYDEDRVMYKQFDLFKSGEERTIHLGIDLFVVPETPVIAPINGIVHSFQDNCHAGDYGPTIILEHEISDLRFWTL